MRLCTHLKAAIADPKPRPTGKDRVCIDCIKIGTKWVHLRTCQTCGETRCCDSSPMQHATHHYGKTGHPVVQSAEPGEDWFWCYDDELTNMRGG